MTNTTTETKKPFVPFIILIITISLVFFWHFNKKRKTAEMTGDKGTIEFPREGFLSPDFTLPDMIGNKVTLSEYRGKIVFINFWATWCPTCDEEMASMERLYRLFKDKDFEMLTISIDKERKLVDEYVAKNQLTFPVLLDPKNKTGKLYQTTGVPETFILDKTGKIIHKVIGPRDWAIETSINSFRALIEG